MPTCRSTWRPATCRRWSKGGKTKVASIPQTNGFTHITLNTQMAPFDNVKVRQAVAAALPYDDMFKAAIFGRGRKLYDADWTGTPPNASFPQPMPVRTDLAQAKQLLAEAGLPNGFSTQFAFSTGQSATAEPLAALVKESLGKIGIQVDIQKKPDAEFNTLEVRQEAAILHRRRNGLAALHLLLLLPVFHP